MNLLAIIRRLYIRFRERKAQRALARMVQQTRSSEEIILYRHNRNKMLRPERKAHIAELLEGIR